VVETLGSRPRSTIDVSGQRDRDEHVRQLDAVPRGERVPDALLKIGQCQKSLGDAGRAKRSWERIVRDYPASVAARQARVLLRN
jgi:TolA-binding protein